MDLFNLPNSLTLLRILLVPVFSYLFLKGEYRWALLVFAITGLTDIVDGTLARVLKKKTTLGAVLDPAADKLLMLVTFIILAMKRLVPVYLSVIVIARDAWIVLGLLFLKQQKRKLYFAPTRLSKLNTFCQLLTIFLAFLLALATTESDGMLLGQRDRIAQLLQWVIYLTAGMTILSGIDYTRLAFMIYLDRREYADLPLKKNKVDRQ